MCSDCEQDLNPPCGCPGCNDCVEPEITVVRRLNTIDPCQGIVDTVRGMIEVPDIKCAVKIISTTVDGSNVTINTETINQTLEYSDDGISFQSSPTFLNQPCGSKKYYARQRAYTACIASIYVTVDENCQCVPNPQPVVPPVTQCIGGFINVKTNDGCGNDGWEPTSTPCGGCTPNMQDVSPPVTRCNTILNKLEYFQTDGCGGTNWRLSNEPCNVCTSPVVPGAPSIQNATCNQQGQPQANASFSIGPVTNADKYGLSFGVQYNGPDYSSASVIAVNGIITASNLQGYSYPTQYVLRVFNQSGSCFVDKTIVLPGVECQQPCVYPTGTLFNTNPSCSTGGASNSDGYLSLQNMQNSTRYEVCPGFTFNCTPNYASATPISGPGPFVVQQGIGFTSAQQYKDYTVRVYNGSAQCFSDFPFRFSNPCFNGGPGNCTVPTYTSATPGAATCNGGTPNNNATITITGITNASKFGYSVGNTYSGPDYSGATSLGGSSINLASLNGSANNTNYVIRIFSTTGACYTDVPVTVPGVPCIPDCTLPQATNPVPTQATCSDGVPNNDAKILISNITNANRIAYFQGNTYLGPDYDSATTIVGSSHEFINLLGLPSNTNYIIRLFNGSNTCRRDYTTTILGKNCDTNPCVSPTTGSSTGTQATCGSGSTINNNASISITGITNTTRWGYSSGTSYTGPVYSSANNLSGSSISITNLPGSASTTNYVVRLFNTDNNCYMDLPISIPGRTCPDPCTNPTFDIAGIPPTNCVGENSSNDGIIRISNIVNGTKYQICIDSTFSCTPNFDGSPVISGSGPIDVFSALGFLSTENSKTVWVRVYNGNETCYTQKSVTVNNPCKSCCGGFTINSIELNNI